MLTHVSKRGEVPAVVFLTNKLYVYDIRDCHGFGHSFRYCPGRHDAACHACLLGSPSTGQLNSAERRLE